MKTVGEILKEARIKKKFTLPDISKASRINIKYLQAIEHNEFKQLPPAAFTKGFIQNYAKLVDLDPKKVLAIFRRDFDQDDRGRIIPRMLTKPVRQRFNVFTPTTTAIALSTAFVVIIATFFIRQMIIFLSAPELEVTTPVESQEVMAPITVSGRTDTQASLSINDQSVGVDDAGNFSTEIDLSPGMHTIIVVATSRSNKQTQVDRQVLVVDKTAIEN